MAKWIQKAVGKNPGGLHRSLGVKEGEKIPEAKLRAAANSKDPKVRKQASLAMTLEGMHHGAEKKKSVNVSKLRSKMYGGKTENK